jgi:hypothetical protein
MSSAQNVRLQPGKRKRGVSQFDGSGQTSGFELTDLNSVSGQFS